MAHIVKYYSGTFHAQFETGKATPIYSLMNSAEVELQPRFMLEGAYEIDKHTYESATLNPQQPFLQRKLTEGIELVFGADSAKRVTLKEVTLQWTKDDVKHQRVWSFMAEKNGRRHGRLKATGFIAVTEELIEKAQSKEYTATSYTPPDLPTVGAEDQSVSAPIIPSAPTPSLSARGGCSPLRGLRMGLPGGCGMRGCGFLAIIPLLLVLLGMLRQCQDSRNEETGNRQEEDGQGASGRNGDGQNGTDQDGRTRDGALVIYDTVYIERVKERVDTLMLFKTDTVEMVESSKQTVFKPVVLPNVQFYTNSANLIPTSLSDIQQLAQHLIDTPELNAIVIGHTDNIGDKQSNLKLSQRRAETVRNVIISMGVEANRIKAVGKGDSEPKADNGSEEGRLMNRRVEVQLAQTVVQENKTTRKK
jgi:outer membrane protein OmpA-like peptidoglycan-associated protein